MGSYAKFGISCKDDCKVWYQGFGPLGKLYGHPTSKSDVSKAPKEGSKARSNLADVRFFVHVLVLRLACPLSVIGRNSGSTSP